MSERRRRRHGADLPALPPDDRDEIIRAFSAALRQVREEETEMLRLTLYRLELFHDGMIALLADMRDGRLS
jgi:hypothetical protein